MKDTSTNSAATERRRHEVMRWCLIAALIALLLDGCKSKRTTTTDGSGPSVDISSSPRTESPTTESPQQGGNNGSAISIPSLPIGGTAVSADGVHQCATVVWSGPPDNIAQGIRLTLTIRVQPATYRESDAGCPPGGAPRCQGYTFTAAQRGPCDVGLESIRQPSTDATLYLDGMCSRESSCTDLLQAITQENQNQEPQGIPITGQATTDTSSTTDSSPPDSTPSTAGG